MFPEWIIKAPSVSKARLKKVIPMDGWLGERDMHCGS